MGCPRLFAAFQRDDFCFLQTPLASLETGLLAGDRGCIYFSAVRRGRARRRAGRTHRDAILHRILAFLALLVSASVFSFLFRGTGISGSPRESELAGRETDCVRSLAVWRPSRFVAGAVCNAGAQRIYTTGLPDVFRLPGGARRDSLLPERVARLLVGDDLFGGGLRDRLRNCDVISDREPVVRNGWH